MDPFKEPPCPTWLVRFPCGTSFQPNQFPAMPLVIPSRRQPPSSSPCDQTPLGKKVNTTRPSLVSLTTHLDRTPTRRTAAPNCTFCCSLRPRAYDSASIQARLDGPPASPFSSPGFIVSSETHSAMLPNGHRDKPRQTSDDHVLTGLHRPDGHHSHTPRARHQDDVLCHYHVCLPPLPSPSRCHDAWPGGGHAPLG